MAKLVEKLPHTLTGLVGNTGTDFDFRHNLVMDARQDKGKYGWVYSSTGLVGRHWSKCRGKAGPEC